MELETIKRAVEWGPGLLIGVLIVGGFFRLADRVGMRMVAASEKQATALSAQAQSMESLTSALREFVTRDSSEHREMLVLLRFLSQDSQGFGSEEVLIER